MKAPKVLETDRLLLRKPKATDAEAIFERYAGDPIVGRYLAWPTHNSIEETRAFLEFCDLEWERSPAGAYLIFARDGENLLGSTGFAFELPHRASTGYVLAADAWGYGYATEAVTAIRDLAPTLGVERLYAACHPDHSPSRRVLEKAEFELEGTLRHYCEFPNLKPGIHLDVVCYSWIS